MMEKQFHQSPNVYVGEVNINVTDLDRAVTFYQDVIGFQVLEQSDNQAVLTADGKTSLLTLEHPADVTPKERGTSGLFHFAILLPSRADLSAFLRHLVQMDYRQIGAADHEVSEAIYLNDPDGNGIEVYRDRPSAEWRWSDGTVAMGTDPLDGEGLVTSSEKEWNGLPPETLMGHIHLHVSDLHETEQFYMDGLGFSIVCRYPGALFTSTGGYHHHIGLNVWNGEGVPAPSPNSAGMNWFTLVFPNEDTRAKAASQLQSIGATVEIEQQDYVTTDPSGNVIRLQII